MALKNPLYDPVFQAVKRDHGQTPARFHHWPDAASPRERP
jgi:hypothetical protein